jgi:predicted O-linked N-acetylglucosamine transferase (SPINDLY family)
MTKPEPEDLDAQAALTASLTALFSEQPLRFERLSEHFALCNRLGLKYEVYRGWRIWCAQNPSNQSAWMNAAIAAWNARLAGEALYCASQLLAFDPVDPDYEQEALRIMASACPFSSAYDQAGMSTINRRYAAIVSAQADDLGLTPLPARRPTGERVRLGYLWSFFGVGTEFCFPFQHDRDRFEIIAVMPETATCTSGKIGVDQLLRFPANDTATANAVIRAAELDILVVLDGRGGSMEIDRLVETRLAPTQAYFGNFFASTFSPAVDALLGDRALIDTLRQGPSSETLIPIAEPIMPVRNPFFAAHDGTDRMPPRPRRFRLGTTGNTLKLSSDFMDLMAMILRRIPDASFYYGTFHSHEDCESARQQLQARGAPPESLELYPWVYGDYTSMINSIDLAIDAIPYNGHLSSYEFLSLGTPVWSLRGPRLTQRYGEMILGAVGERERLFDDAETLIATLVRDIRLNSAAERLALKKRVAASGLGDPVRATRLFEAALNELLATAHSKLAGSPPAVTEVKE